MADQVCEVGKRARLELVLEIGQVPVQINLVFVLDRFVPRKLAQVRAIKWHDWLREVWRLHALVLNRGEKAHSPLLELFK